MDLKDISEEKSMKFIEWVVVKGKREEDVKANAEDNENPII